MTNKNGSEDYRGEDGGILRDELREQVEAVLKSNLSRIIGGDYIEPVFDKIKDGVVEDIRVRADHDGWSNGDLRLAIGRVLCDELGCGI